MEIRKSLADGILGGRRTPKGFATEDGRGLEAIGKPRFATSLFVVVVLMEKSLVGRNLKFPLGYNSAECVTAPG